MKSFIKAILISCFALLSHDAKAGGRGMPSVESRELIMLYNYLSKIVQSDPNNPKLNKINWSEIWNTDEFVEIWSKTSLTNPWERYHFLSDDYPMLDIYRGRPAGGHIILIKTKSSNLQDRGDSTSQEGFWWDCIWLNKNGRLEVGQLPMEAIPSRNGATTLPLKEPNIPQEWIADYESKLINLGFEPFKAVESHLIEPSVGVADQEGSSLSSMKPASTFHPVEKQVNNKNDKVLWIIGGVLLMVIAWLLLKRRS